MLRVAASIVLVMGAVAIGFDSGAAEEYVIKIDRVPKVGQSVDLRVVAARKMERQSDGGGEAQQDQERVEAVELEARATILELDKRGLKKRMSLEVRKCDALEEGKKSELLPAGSKLVLEAGKGRMKFVLEGGILTERQQRLLGLAVVMTEEEMPTSDEIYVPKERKAAGASWPVDREKLAAHASVGGMKVEAKDVEGKVTLEEVEQLEGKPHLRLKSSTTLRHIGFTLGKEQVAAGMVHRSGQRASTYSGLYPADPESLYYRSSWDSVQVMQVESPGRRPGRVVITTYTSHYGGTIEQKPVE